MHNKPCCLGSAVCWKKMIGIKLAANEYCELRLQLRYDRSHQINQALFASTDLA